MEETHTDRPESTPAIGAAAANPSAAASERGASHHGKLSAATTRRSFLLRTSLLGVGLPALSAALGACADEGEREEHGEARARQGAPATAVVPFQRFDPVLTPVPPGREHDLRFVVRDATVAIASDAALRAWTFNGTVPGPVIHVRQGDTVRVTLTNEGSIAHSIDFHAAEIDAGTAFRSIAPGQSLSYSFSPRYAGAFLYHCSTSPILLHIGSGMYGAIIVDPAEPLPPAREFVLVHSGFYVGRGGEEEGAGEGGRGASEEKHSGGAAGAQAEREVFDPSFQKMLYAFPNYTAFNGYAYQYRNEPIRVRRGERVRFYVVNAGPTQDCSFHVVGGIFDTVYLGAPPGNTISGVQTYGVPAGGGMIFELEGNLPGSFPFVNHKSGHGDKGATGLLIIEP